MKLIISKLDHKKRTLRSFLILIAISFYNGYLQLINFNNFIIEIKYDTYID